MEHLEPELKLKKNRGFAAMDAQRQRQIASKGGKAAHARGTAHEFDSEEARVAGRKGGLTVSQNREHMAAIGRSGGKMRGLRAREARAILRGEMYADVSSENSQQSTMH